MLLIKLIILIAFLIYAINFHIRINKNTHINDDIPESPSKKDKIATPVTIKYDIDKDSNSKYSFNYIEPNSHSENLSEPYCPYGLSYEENAKLNAQFTENCPWCESRNSCIYSTNNEVLEKGDEGELETYNALSSLINPEKYPILRDLYIAKTGKHFSQIDILLIHATGIYVIESKNWSTKISGDPNMKFINPNHNDPTNRSQNPIIQNENHIKTLTNFLNKKLPNLTSKLQYISILAFGNACDYTSLLNSSPNLLITSYNKLAQDLSYYIINNTSNTELLSQSDIKLLTEILNPCLNISEDLKKEHILHSIETQKKQLNLFINNLNVN